MSVAYSAQGFFVCQGNQHETGAGTLSPVAPQGDRIPLDWDLVQAFPLMIGLHPCSRDSSAVNALCAATEFGLPAFLPVHRWRLPKQAAIVRSKECSDVVHRVAL